MSEHDSRHPIESCLAGLVEAHAHITVHIFLMNNLKRLIYHQDPDTQENYTGAKHALPFLFTTYRAKLT